VHDAGGAHPVVSPPTARADFRPGEPDLTSFPRVTWAAAARAVLRDAPSSTFGYGDEAGLPELRAALTAYLGRARAVVASPERVFVFSGFGDALVALRSILGGTATRPVALEEPCLPWHRAWFERAGVPVVGIPVDEEGVDATAVTAAGAGALLTTPAHQYPLGVTLSSRRRTALVEWARDADTWIVEDDFDGEYRYDRQAVGALQALAPDRVIYAGSASKTIAPGVGIGWLVLPTALTEPMRELLRFRVSTSLIEQAVLARFIDGGHLDRHLRRMRTVYRRRRDDLFAVLAGSPQLSVRGIAAGLHVTATVASPDRERALRQRAAEASVGLFPLSYHYGSMPAQHGFVFGFTRPPQHAWAGALRRLGAVLTATA
jgi:GntR family transcriptional regulator / MocR family aminotransferase